MTKYKDDESVFSEVPKGVKSRLLGYEGKFPPSPKHQKGKTSVGVSLLRGKDECIIHESKYETDDSYLGERADIITVGIDETGHRQVKARRYTVGHRANINNALKNASSLREKRKLVRDYRKFHPVKGVSH